MTPLDFIASLPHGEAKAAALTAHNLTTPKWIEITDDPATLPEVEQTVIIRMHADNGGGEQFGLRDGGFPDYWQWFHSPTATWNSESESIEISWRWFGKTPTHWRPVS